MKDWSSIRASGKVFRVVLESTYILNSNMFSYVLSGARRHIFPAEKLSNYLLQFLSFRQYIESCLELKVRYFILHEYFISRVFNIALKVLLSPALTPLPCQYGIEFLERNV